MYAGYEKEKELNVFKYITRVVAMSLLKEIDDSVSNRELDVQLKERGYRIGEPCPIEGDTLEYRQLLQSYLTTINRSTLFDLIVALPQECKPAFQTSRYGNRIECVGTPVETRILKRQPNKSVSKVKYMHTFNRRPNLKITKKRLQIVFPTNVKTVSLEVIKHLYDLAHYHEVKLYNYPTSRRTYLNKSFQLLAGQNNKFSRIGNISYG